MGLSDAIRPAAPGGCALNDEDRRLAALAGRELETRLLALPPSARLRIEAETDRHGHIRGRPRITVEQEVGLEDAP